MFHDVSIGTLVCGNIGFLMGASMTYGIRKKSLGYILDEAFTLTVGFWLAVSFFYTGW